MPAPHPQAGQRQRHRAKSLSRQDQPEPVQARGAVDQSIVTFVDGEAASGVQGHREEVQASMQRGEELVGADALAVER